MLVSHTHYLLSWGITKRLAPTTTPTCLSLTPTACWAGVSPRDWLLRQLLHACLSHPLPVELGCHQETGSYDNSYMLVSHTHCLLSWGVTKRLAPTTTPTCLSLTPTACWAGVSPRDWLLRQLLHACLSHPLPVELGYQQETGSYDNSYMLVSHTHSLLSWGITKRLAPTTTPTCLSLTPTACWAGISPTDWLLRQLLHACLSHPLPVELGYHQETGSYDNSYMLVSHTHCLLSWDITKILAPTTTPTCLSLTPTACWAGVSPIKRLAPTTTPTWLSLTPTACWAWVSPRDWLLRQLLHACLSHPLPVELGYHQETGSYDNSYMLVSHTHYLLSWGITKRLAPTTTPTCLSLTPTTCWAGVSPRDWLLRQLLHACLSHPLPVELGYHQETGSYDNS